MSTLFTPFLPVLPALGLPALGCGLSLDLKPFLANSSKLTFNDSLSLGTASVLESLYVSALAEHFRPSRSSTQCAANSLYCLSSKTLISGFKTSNSCALENAQSPSLRPRYRAERKEAFLLSISGLSRFSLSDSTSLYDSLIPLPPWRHPGSSTHRQLRVVIGKQCLE